MLENINWDKIYDVAITIFKDILRIDTTNPPGNEEVLEDYLISVLKKYFDNTKNIDIKKIYSEEGRSNLYVRIKGRGKESPILLTSHVDVVPAVLERWKYHPFSATEENGFIYGRGTLDMKNMTVYNTMALLFLSWYGIIPNRDVVMLALADEERGGRNGSWFLVKKYSSLLDGIKFGFNEVGGFTMHINGKRIYPIQVAEKGYVWIKIIIRGRSSHASIPTKDNPFYKLSEIINILDAVSSKLYPNISAILFLRAIKGGKIDFYNEANLNEVIGSLPSNIRNFVFATFRNTISPTVISGGEAQNIIPGEIELKCDVRLLPGKEPMDFYSEIKALLHSRYGKSVEVELIARDPSTVVPKISIRDPVYSIIKREIKKADKGAVVTRYLLPGYTDAKAFSELGIKIYGFSPVKLDKETDFWTLIHSDNERIPISGFKWGLKVFLSVFYRIITERIGI